VPLFPRRFKLPIPPGMDLRLTPGEQPLLRRQIATEYMKRGSACFYFGGVRRSFLFLLDAHQE
jgi:hypothetical protein